MVQRIQLVEDESFPEPSKIRFPQCRNKSRYVARWKINHTPSFLRWSGPPASCAIPDEREIPAWQRLKPAMVLSRLKYTRAQWGGVIFPSRRGSEGWYFEKRLSIVQQVLKNVSLERSWEGERVEDLPQLPKIFLPEMGHP